VDQLQDPNLNALWCRAIAEELHRCGVGAAVLCPGSRNSPLLYALHRELGDACLSHVDERSAGFIALGLAKSAGGPVAICVTSGSAVANLLPALTEAHAAGIPLVVVSADRPWEAHGAAAPQTMPQTGLFGRFVVDELALGEPLADDLALRALRARLCWLVSAAERGHGPVHLNVPLRDPLPPLPDPAWRPAGLSSEALSGRAGALVGGAVPRPFVAICGDGLAGEAERDAADGASIGMVRDLLFGELPLEPRGLIVAGTAAMLAGERVARLAAATGFPVIADATGPLRWELQDEVVATADALLTGALGHTAAEVIIQLGPAPLARATWEYLDRQRCPWLVIGARARAEDFLHRAGAALVAPGDRDLELVAAAVGRAPAAWTRAWTSAEAAARDALRRAMASEPWGEVLAAHRAVSHQGFDLLHLASSMAVRHANLHCLPGGRSRTVTANRGVNGIDGTIGTFLGELAGLAAGQDGGDRDEAPAGGNGLLLIGDLAFLHDLPALAAAERTGARGAIVVLNNDGGGIFDFLAVARMPGYRELVRTPHGLDFAHAAAQFGLAYAHAASDAQLRVALDAAAAGDGLTVIECRVPEGDTVARHRALVRAMAEAGAAPSTPP
jgi:2-succinyl-5-enolpyruvyl-6-hydroxy-3-cyclohexene-1-carboxylate synthase